MASEPTISTRSRSSAGGGDDTPSGSARKNAWRRANAATSRCSSRGTVFCGKRSGDEFGDAAAQFWSMLSGSAGAATHRSPMKASKERWIIVTTSRTSSLAPFRSLSISTRPSCCRLSSSSFSFIDTRMPRPICRYQLTTTFR